MVQESCSSPSTKLAFLQRGDEHREHGAVSGTSRPGLDLDQGRQIEHPDRKTAVRQNLGVRKKLVVSLPLPSSQSGSRGPRLVDRLIWPLPSSMAAVGRRSRWARSLRMIASSRTSTFMSWLRSPRFGDEQYRDLASQWRPCSTAAVPPTTMNSTRSAASSVSSASDQRQRGASRTEPARQPSHRDAGTEPSRSDRASASRMSDDRLPPPHGGCRDHPRRDARHRCPAERPWRWWHSIASSTAF